MRGKERACARFSRDLTERATARLWGPWNFPRCLWIFLRFFSRSLCLAFLFLGAKKIFLGGICDDHKKLKLSTAGASPLVLTVDDLIANCDWRFLWYEQRGREKMQKKRSVGVALPFTSGARAPPHQKKLWFCVSPRAERLARNGELRGNPARMSFFSDLPLKFGSPSGRPNNRKALPQHDSTTSFLWLAVFSFGGFCFSALSRTGECVVTRP